VRTREAEDPQEITDYLAVRIIRILHSGPRSTAWDDSGARPRFLEKDQAVKTLSAKQRELVSPLVKRLGEIPGIKAVVLGGSYARGRAQQDSDIDLGLVYSEAAPFSVERIRELAEEVNDTPSPVVTDFYGWGTWVNGGAWLTINGQRVDFIYRNLEHAS
jgi:predicted nucleotidyltransferase